MHANKKYQVNKTLDEEDPKSGQKLHVGTEKLNELKK